MGLAEVSATRAPHMLGHADPHVCTLCFGLYLSLTAGVVSIQGMSRVLPNTKLVVLLREPVARAVSAFAARRSGKTNTLGSFEQAVRWSLHQMRAARRCPGHMLSLPVDDVTPRCCSGVSHHVRVFFLCR